MQQQLKLPDDPNVLEEANLHCALAASLAGQEITVDLKPEEGSRQLKERYVPTGTPIKLSYTDSEGRVWRFPRRWLPEHRSSEPPLELPYEVTREFVQREWLHLPPREDLEEINLPGYATRVYSNRPVEVEVRYRPNEPVRVTWRDEQDGSGAAWRIPNDWRKRRICLPALEVLVAQGIPLDVADECCGRSVSVNYHPGSLYCLREHYRFCDAYGHKWPVRIVDCTVVGLGNEPEHAE